MKGEKMTKKVKRLPKVGRISLGPMDWARPLANNCYRPLMFVAAIVQMVIVVVMITALTPLGPVWAAELELIFSSAAPTCVAVTVLAVVAYRAAG